MTNEKMYESGYPECSFGRYNLPPNSSTSYNHENEPKRDMRIQLQHQSHKPHVWAHALAACGGSRHSSNNVGSWCPPPFFDMIVPSIAFSASRRP